MTVQATRASQILSLEHRLRERLACPALVAVHRLDRETSGAVLFARDAAAAARLGAAFAARAACKRYVAVVSPSPGRAAWRVRGFMSRTLHPARFRFALHETAAPGRRPSETLFRLRELRAGRALVEARPITGRTHQIRVHLAAGATPVAGDPIYGGDADSGRAGACARQGGERMQLHAESILIPAAGGAAREIQAPWPRDFGLGFDQCAALATRSSPAPGSTSTRPTTMRSPSQFQRMGEMMPLNTKHSSSTSPMPKPT
jgi:tRNA pseudouridine32 synthase/23S rRNA pseudouridine746 synthase